MQNKPLAKAIRGRKYAPEQAQEISDALDACLEKFGASKTARAHDEIWRALSDIQTEKAKAPPEAKVAAPPAKGEEIFRIKSADFSKHGPGIGGDCRA